MTVTPLTIFSLYVLTGISFVFWSRQFTPQANMHLDEVFRQHKGVWVVGMFILALIWPIIALSITYRWFFRSKDHEESDR